MELDTWRSSKLKSDCSTTAHRHGVPVMTMTSGLALVPPRSSHEEGMHVGDKVEYP